MSDIGFLTFGSIPSIIPVSLPSFSLLLLPLIRITMGTILCGALPGLQISILYTNFYIHVREGA